MTVKNVETRSTFVNVMNECIVAQLCETRCINVSWFSVIADYSYPTRSRVLYRETRFVRVTDHSLLSVLGCRTCWQLRCAWWTICALVVVYCNDRSETYT